MDALLFAAPATPLPTIVAAIFGLLIGSFLNVVIYRLPKILVREFENSSDEHDGRTPRHGDKLTLSTPRSTCPHCGHQIRAIENIPVLSWLALRGKCSACKAPISVRYPAIELFSSAVAAAMVWHLGTGVAGMAAVAVGFLLIAMTMIDFDTQLLPEELTLPLIGIALAVNLDGAFAPLRESVIGLVAGFLALWTVSALYKLVRGVDGMGEGDFKLLAGLGALLGWKMLPTIILLSSVVGATVGICLIVFKGHGREVPIPFGPYLTGAGLIAILFAPQLTRLSNGFLGG